MGKESFLPRFNHAWILGKFRLYGPLLVPDNGQSMGRVINHVGLARTGLSGANFDDVFVKLVYALIVVFIFLLTPSDAIIHFR